MILENVATYRRLPSAGTALVLLALTGCAELHPKVPLPPQPGAEAVTLTKEQDGRFVAFVGPKTQHGEAFLGVPDTNYDCLRSWLDTTTGEAAHQLYVEDSYYGDPYQWDGATDDSGTALRFIAISRNQISCEESCSYADEFAAGLPEELLRASPKGVLVTFTSRSGKTQTVAVSGQLIAAQLAAVDAVRAARPTAQAAPPPVEIPDSPATPAPAAPPGSGGR